MSFHRSVAATMLLASTVLSPIAVANDAETGTVNSVATSDLQPPFDEIIVEGRFLSLDKINAVKTPTPIINIPQSLSIIDKEQITRQAFTNIGDITRYTPGISISQGEGHRDAIIIRGNQTTADFFIDGLRDDVQYFRPLYNLERVEILRGANALLFGRGGSGGVVNRVTKRPVQDEAFIGVTASVDTFGAHLFAGDINAPVGARGGFRLNAFYEGLNNHRDFFDGERFAVNPTFAYEITSGTDLLLSYEYVNDDRVVDRGVPSQNVEGGPDVPLTGFDNTFFGSPDQNFTTLEAHILRGRLDHTFNDMLRANVTIQYADYDKLYQNLFASEEVFVSDGTFPEVELDGYRDATDRENLIIQGNLVGEFDTGPIGHTLLFGVEYGDQDTANNRRDNVFAANGDDQLVIPFTDPLTIPDFAFSDLSRDRQSQVVFVSVYLQDQIDLTDWLKIVAGLRWDRFDIEVDDLIEQAAMDDDLNDGFLARTDNEISPRFGVIIKPADNISLYGSYSESFLPRSGDQFLTLDLVQESAEPQSVENFEIGAKWDITQGLSLTSAVFRLEQNAATTQDPEDIGQTILLPGTVTEGFEIALNGALTDWWSVNTGFSYLDGQVDGGSFDSNRTRQTPETMFSLWNDFQPTERLGLGVGVTNQGSFFVREDNSVEVPGYTRLDAAIYYDLGDSLRLQVNLENLTDTDYFPDAHSNDNISTGRPFNARFTISGRF